ncbi:MAG: hypothetical protein A2176_06430 [Spirochaetes bacterium RBG_13_51_14]|nr:MAG: hypothetical protein A2176_06430 [Spirochaetes bacterium RBG_13_51_14]
MNIKSVNYEPMDTVGKYARRKEAAEQTGAALSQPKNVSRELSRDDILEIVNKLNTGVREIHERLTFSFHEKTQRVVVKFINTDTNEVIREIPAKEAIKLLEHIQDFLGMIVDESR